MTNEEIKIVKLMVTALRRAHLYAFNPFEPDNQSEHYKYLDDVFHKVQHEVVLGALHQLADEL